LLGQTRYGLILKRKTTTQRRMIVLELIISDAIRRAKTRVPRKGLSRVDRQRALIVEALTYVGWDPALRWLTEMLRLSAAGTGMSSCAASPMSGIEGASPAGEICCGAQRRTS
jgi:hypothetical protein